MCRWKLFFVIQLNSIDWVATTENWDIFNNKASFLVRHRIEEILILSNFFWFLNTQWSPDWLNEESNCALWALLNEGKFQFWLMEKITLYLLSLIGMYEMKKKCFETNNTQQSQAQRERKRAQQREQKPEKEKNKVSFNRWRHDVEKWIFLPFHKMVEYTSILDFFLSLTLWNTSSVKQEDEMIFHLSNKRQHQRLTIIDLRSLIFNFKDYKSRIFETRNYVRQKQLDNVIMNLLLLFFLVSIFHLLIWIACRKMMW